MEQNGQTVEKLDLGVYRIVGQDYSALVHTSERYVDCIPQNGQTESIKLTDEGLMRMEVNPVKWVRATPEDIQALRPLKDLLASLNGAVECHKDLKSLIEEIGKSTENHQNNYKASAQCCSYGVI